MGLVERTRSSTLTILELRFFGSFFPLLKMMKFAVTGTDEDWDAALKGKQGEFTPLLCRCE